jgi:hypothetical protein
VWRTRETAEVAERNEDQDYSGGGSKGKKKREEGRGGKRKKGEEKNVGQLKVGRGFDQ